MEEPRTPTQKPTNNPANQTQSVTRNQDAEAWATSLSSQKLLEQKDIEDSDKETISNDFTNVDSKPDSNEDCGIIEGKRHKARRISTPPLKKLRKVEFVRPSGQ